MKTVLPKEINTVDEAKKFLFELLANGESYHPEDDAHDIIWATPAGQQAPTDAEKDQLNDLMSDIYELDGFDPCGYLIDMGAFKDVSI